MKELATDHPISVICQPKRKGEIEKTYSDITRARRVLGFQPKITLEEGVEQLCRLTWLSTDARIRSCHHHEAVLLSSRRDGPLEATNSGDNRLSN